MSSPRIAAIVLAATLLAAPSAAAQTPALELSGPGTVATGVGFEVTGTGGAPGTRVTIQIALDGRWRRLARAAVDQRGRFERRVRTRKLRTSYLLRARAPDGRLSPRIRVRTRDVTLAAVGDVNLGNGPGVYINGYGVRYPWTSVAPALRRADVAFGNLESAVSNRGAPVPKQFTFRGRPSALRAMSEYAGFDVLNLANNHVGDYGTTALLDTVKYVRRYGMLAVGAGGSIASAAKPRVIERLGLKIAFVGFSDILPASFFAGPDRAGTQQALTEAISANVRQARRRADVVIATFHWGVERATVENARQRGFAATALAAGAGAVIGAHPHVLQPVRRRGRRLVAYSLGNFVFGAASPGTTSTGILNLRLSTRGVEDASFRRAVIQGTRPVLRRR